MSLILSVVGLCSPQLAYGYDPDAPSGGVTPPVPVVTGLPTAPTAVAAVAAPGAPKEMPKDLMPQNLFLHDDELKKIKNAIEQYQMRRSRRQRKAEDKAKDFLNELEDKVEEAKAKPAPKPVPFTYPQFFLSQISYQDPTDWVIWLNGKKFAAYLPTDDGWIRIAGVDKEQVVIEWRPDNMKVINYSLMLVPLEETQAGNVIVNNALDTVTFTLKPNQTFSSYAMRVVEGKISPISVMLLDGEPVSAATYGTLPNTIEPQTPAQKDADEELQDDEEIPTDAEKAASAKSLNDDNTGAEALDRTYKKIGINE